MAPYTAFKIIHMLGIVLFLGNIIVTGVWKAFADRTGNAEVVAFAQRLVTLTDWVFTFGGVVLILIGGYGMAAAAGYDLRLTLAPLGAGDFHRLGRDLGRDPHSPPDPAGAARPWFRERRRDPAELLAAEPAMVFLGRSRHRHPARQSLCDGGQALNGNFQPGCRAGLPSLSVNGKIPHKKLRAIGRALAIAASA